MTKVNIKPIKNNDSATPELFNSRFAAIVSVVNGKLNDDNFAVGGIGTASIADGAVTAAKIETQQAWQPVTYQNSWVDYDVTYGGAQFYKDSAGVVHLRGLVKNGSTSGTIFTLPAGYRPNIRLLFAIEMNSNAIGRVDILADGQVQPQGVNNAWVSLSNITFKADS